jgi:hypothetical protein
VLLFVEGLDSITGFLILPKPGFVLAFVKLGLFVPQFALENVDCRWG